MIFTRDFVTRENYRQIASLVIQKSLFRVTHASFFISSCQYRNSRDKDKTVCRPSYLYHGISHTRKVRLILTLEWRHNGPEGVLNHQPHDCLLNRLFSCRSKKTTKLRVTCLCAGNSPVTGKFPAQGTSNADIVSIWWRHHEPDPCCIYIYIPC